MSHPKFLLSLGKQKHTWRLVGFRAFCLCGGREFFSKLASCGGCLKGNIPGSFRAVSRIWTALVCLIELRLQSRGLRLGLSALHACTFSLYVKMTNNEWEREGGGCFIIWYANGWWDWASLLGMLLICTVVFTVCRDFKGKTPGLACLTDVDSVGTDIASSLSNFLVRFHLRSTAETQQVFRKGWPSTLP